jgi:hypothetical protein
MVLHSLIVRAASRIISYDYARTDTTVSMQDDTKVTPHVKNVIIMCMTANGIKRKKKKR